MNWLIDNWYIILALFALAVGVGFGVYRFFKLPMDKRIANVKKWLEWAVAKAENKLGGGTGQLKLRMVYNMAVKEFPWLIEMVSFDTFSDWVDDALDWLRGQLKSNEAVKTIVEADGWEM